jgi:hypothetical protein
MIAFKKVNNPPQGSSNWRPLNFREGRAMWRDSLALLESAGVQDLRRPSTIDWMEDLIVEGIIDESRRVGIDILGFGLRPGQTPKVIFWRHERLAVPLVYLQGERGTALIELLGLAIHQAEDVFREMNYSLRLMAQGVVVRAKGEGPLSREDGRRISDFVRSLGADREYWPRLEVAFKEMVIRIAEGGSMESWTLALRAAAVAAFESAASSVNEIGPYSKARAQARTAFRQRLARVINQGGAYDNTDNSG